MGGACGLGTGRKFLGGVIAVGSEGKDGQTSQATGSRLERALGLR